MSLSLLDGILLAVMLISAILAMMRGFVREVFAIGTWIGAGAAALFFHPLVLPYIEPHVGNDLLSVALAAAAVFFLTLIILSFITIRISDFVLDSGIGPIDRTLGFLFGAARGLLIVVLAVMIFNGLVQRENRPGWVTNAQSLPSLLDIGGRITAALPEDVQETIASFFGNVAPRSDSSDLPDSGPETEPADVEDEAPPEEDVPIEIPQEDSRNVERIINASPDTADSGSSTTTPVPPAGETTEDDEVPAPPAPQNQIDSEPLEPVINAN